MVWPTFIFTTLFNGCTFVAPVRQLPTESNITLDFIRVPIELKRNEIGEFIITTDPGSVCIATIRFISVGSDMGSHELKRQIAGTKGICKWLWEVPTSIDYGTVEFRVAVETKEGTRMAIPKLINIAPE